MVLNFKVDTERNVYLLYCSFIQLKNNENNTLAPHIQSLTRSNKSVYDANV